MFGASVESIPDRLLEQTQLTKNRHGGRINLLTPDPQVISRKLFTRTQSNSDLCNRGFGLPNNSPDANCDYQKAPFFNVLAAYWIQFMTHDWFSHMEEGHNDPQMMEVGCTTQKVNGVETPLTADDIQKLGCRPSDRVDKTYMLQDSPPDQFTSGGRTYLTRAPKTFFNNNTAWWDASQLYGFDDVSVKRVKRDPKDAAKMLLEPVSGAGGGYLPVLSAGDPAQPQWAGQESVAFPDNWSIGLSFYHNLFAREHNSFVDEFRKQAARKPTADSGLRDPSDPKKVIRNKDVSDDELFDAARLVVAAEIAKIHTIEWTPQLLYNEPLYKGMNANWNGLLGTGDPDTSKALADVVTHGFGHSKNATKESQWYSVFASGPGIFGMGSKSPHYDVSNPNDVNGGVNHFGSPFNFPEEFVTVYRLHPLVPDLIEYRDVAAASPSEAFRYLSGLIIEDEIRHHRIFRDLAAALKHDVELDPAEPVIPKMGDWGHDAATVLSLTENLLERERADAIELRELASELKSLKQESLWQLLVRLMEMDTAKHIEILEFVQRNVKKSLR